MRSEGHVLGVPLRRGILLAGGWALLVVGSVLVGVTAGRNLSTYLTPLIFAALVVFFAVVAPELCLWVILAALPFSFRFFLPNRSELQIPTEPVVAALVGAYFLDRIVARVRGKPYPPYPLMKPLAVYALAVLLSISQSPYLFESTKGALRWIAFVLFPLPVFMLVATRRAFFRAIVAATGAGVVAAVIQSFFLLDRFDELAHTTAYLNTLFTNYAIYGFYLSAFLLMLFARMLFDGSYHRIGYWTLFTLFGLAMLLCLSRGAWLGLFAGIGLLLMLRSNVRPARKWGFLAGGVAFALLLLMIPGVFSTVLARTTTLLDPSYASNKTRLLRWGFALLMFAQHPILGGGFGSFALTYPNEAFLGANRLYQMGAHNEHLQILAETGLVGFLAWAWLNVAYVVYGFRLLKRLGDDPFWYSIVAGFLAVEVMSLAHLVVENFSAVDLFNVVFWFGFGALPAIERIAAREGACASDGDRTT